MLFTTRGQSPASYNILESAYSYSYLIVVRYRAGRRQWQGGQCSPTSRYVRPPPPPDYYCHAGCLCLCSGHSREARLTCCFEITGLAKLGIIGLQSRNRTDNYPEIIECRSIGYINALFFQIRNPSLRTACVYRGGAEGL